MRFLRTDGRYRARAMLATVLLIVGYLCFLQLNRVAGRFNRFNVNRLTLFDQGNEKVSAYDTGTYQAVNFINEEIDKEDKILTFRFSDVAFYTENPLAVQLDPRYLDLFTAESEDEVGERLQQHEIRYIHVPAYTEPALYNSAFGSFVGDPDRVELVYFYRGVRIYRVIESVTVEPRARLPIYAETFSESTVTGERWTVFSSKTRFTGQWQYQNSALAAEARPAGIFESPEEVTIYSGRGLLLNTPAATFERIPIRPATLYLLEVDYSGNGLVAIDLFEYDHAGAGSGPIRLWEDVLEGRNKSPQIQFLTSADTADIRIGVKIDNGASVALRQVALSEIGSNLKSEELPPLFLRGWTATTTLAPDEDSAPVNSGVDSTGDDATVFLYARDSRYYYLHSPSFAFDQIPEVISLTLRGHGRAQLDLLWSCEEENCDGVSRLGTDLLLADEPSELALNAAQQILADRALYSNLYFHNDAALSYGRDARQYKFRVRFQLYQDPRLRGTRHDNPELEIHNVNFRSADGSPLTPTEVFLPSDQ